MTPQQEIINRFREKFVEKVDSFGGGTVSQIKINDPQVFESFITSELTTLIEKQRRNKEDIFDKLRVLNATLREQCIDTQLITIEQWNEEIAPKLSELNMAIEEVKVTAKTYRLPENYHKETKSYH